MLYILLMNITIFHPCWDHVEILGGLLYYLKNRNINLTLIYDYSHDEGNYLEYYLSIYSFENIKSIQYTNIKSITKYFIKSDYFIVVDEIYLDKIMKKDIFLNNKLKIISFNHRTKKTYRDIPKICLGIIPYNNIYADTKYLIPNYFIDYNFKHKNITRNDNIKKYLIIGQLDNKNINYLNNLKNDYIVYIITRKEYDIKNNNKIKFIKNISTNKLINLLSTIDFVLTLFKDNSNYHKNRISGIIPFCISYGIPFITDYKYYHKNTFNFIDNNLIYHNNKDDFILSFNYSYNINNKEWLIMHKNILKYRDNIINKNNKIYDKLF